MHPTRSTATTPLPTPASPISTTTNSNTPSTSTTTAQTDARTAEEGELFASGIGMLPVQPRAGTTPHVEPNQDNRGTKRTRSDQGNRGTKRTRSGINSKLLIGKPVQYDINSKLLIGKPVKYYVNALQTILSDKNNNPTGPAVAGKIRRCVSNMLSACKQSTIDLTTNDVQSLLESLNIVLYLQNQLAITNALCVIQELLNRNDIDYSAFIEGGHSICKQIFLLTFKIYSGSPQGPQQYWLVTDILNSLEAIISKMLAIPHLNMNMFFMLSNDQECLQVCQSIIEKSKHPVDSQKESSFHYAVIRMPDCAQTRNIIQTRSYYLSIFCIRLIDSIITSIPTEMAFYQSELKRLDVKEIPSLVKQSITSTANDSTITSFRESIQKKILTATQRCPSTLEDNMNPIGTLLKLFEQLITETPALD